MEEKFHGTKVGANKKARRNTDKEETECDNNLPKSEEMRMKLQVTKMSTLFSFTNQDDNNNIRAFQKNPEYFTLFRDIFPNLQKQWFPFRNIDVQIDFMEAYVTILKFIMDKRLYTKMIILYRMKEFEVYKIWECIGEFLIDEGFLAQAYIMYCGVALMRMQTRPFQKSNQGCLEKALELSKKINSNDSEQLEVNEFSILIRDWTFPKNAKFSLFLEGLLFKAMSTYLTNQAINFDLALDYEIKYLNRMFNLNYFEDKIDWLICNILNLALNAMDNDHIQSRFIQAKHLVHVSRIIMIRCDRSVESYKVLYELYQLMKCTYWAMKINSDLCDTSNQIVCFNLAKIGIIGNDIGQTEVSQITGRKDIVETFDKISKLKPTLVNSSQKDFVKLYNLIVFTCRQKYSYLTV